MTIEAYAPTNLTETEQGNRDAITSELGARAVPPVIEWGPRKHSDTPENVTNLPHEDIDFTD